MHMDCLPVHMNTTSCVLITSVINHSQPLCPVACQSIWFHQNTVVLVNTSLVIEVRGTDEKLRLEFKSAIDNVIAVSLFTN